MTDTSAKIYGIDLGTTYSCIAYVDEYGKPVVLKNQEGDSTTPSVVQFVDGQSRVVGKEAKNVSQLYPDSVVAMVKREMGTTWRKTYEGKEYAPEEISSYILSKVVQDAAVATGEQVTDVVITVPAYFGIAERAATEAAGKIAGLNVRAILNEPTAAAFAYGMGQEKDMRVLVFDLGGGTFDITLIDITEDAIDVVATGGNHRLGGHDWDTDIVTYLAAQWQAQSGSGEDPLDSPETRNQLYKDAEDRKRSLTVRPSVDIAVSHNGDVRKVTLTREKFEELTRARLEETIAHTRQTLEEAKLVLQARGKPIEPLFHKLLLVGGSTRMPQVTRRLKEEFPGVEPQMFDPDESVAKGAALYGQKLRIGEAIKQILESKGFTGDAPVPEAVEQQAIEQAAEVFNLPGPAVATIVQRDTSIVASRSYGVVVVIGQAREKKVHNLVKKNDKLPLEVSQRFGTLEANQLAANIQVMENVDMAQLASVDDSKELGQAELTLPSGLPANAPIDITYALSPDGILHVVGFDPKAKRSIEAEFRVEGIMTQDEIEELKERSSQITVS
jgi:molecular chaperone DnaK (HSP70)